MDVHGSGAQRSDPKSGKPENYSQGRGPQGDEVRIYNYVRLVRSGNIKKHNIQPAAKGNYEIKAHSASKITSSTHKRKPQQRTGSNMSQQNDSRQQRPQQGHESPPNMMEHLDKNNDGYLSDNELPQGPPPRRKMN